MLINLTIDHTEFNWDAYVNNDQADEVHQELILALEQEHIATNWVPAKPLKKESYAEYHKRGQTHTD